MSNPLPLPLDIVGWREWVSLSDWSVPHIKAKVDTGARTSALHTADIEEFDNNGEAWVRFIVHPYQRSELDEVLVETRVLESRDIRSSSGAVEKRVVVGCSVAVIGIPIDIELTLTRRDDMGFRMLLGRQALRRRFVVDPGSSFLGGRPPLDVRRRNRGRG